MVSTSLSAGSHVCEGSGGRRRAVPRCGTTALRLPALPVVSVRSGGCSGDLGRDPPGSRFRGDNREGFPPPKLCLLCHPSRSVCHPLVNGTELSGPASSQAQIPAAPPPPESFGVPSCDGLWCVLSAFPWPKSGPRLAPQLGSGLRGPPQPQPSGSGPVLRTDFHLRVAIPDPPSGRATTRAALPLHKSPRAPAAPVCDFGPDANEGREPLPQSPWTFNLWESI